VDSEVVRRELMLLPVRRRGIDSESAQRNNAQSAKEQRAKSKEQKLTNTDEPYF